MKRRHRLRRDICSQWKLKHIHDELVEDLNLCYKVEDESLQRMTISQMGVTRTFENVQDRGSWYPVTLDGYIEYQQQRKLLVTPLQNVSIDRVRKAEGECCSTSEGVTAEDPQVRHGTTGWTDYG